jgi:hypothetical protein
MFTVLLFSFPCLISSPAAVVSFVAIGERVPACGGQIGLEVLARSILGAGFFCLLTPIRNAKGKVPTGELSTE